jgi:NADP-dependent 3-hydroxy acid dehydrogenase YdfG
MPDKVMLITGASRGIGAATARLAATRGYAVAINYATRGAAAEAVAADVRKAGRKAVTIKADIGKPEEIARLFKAVDAEFGRLDAFFNNAGIVNQAAKFVEIAPERLQQILAVNTTGAFLAAQEAVRRMSRGLGGQGGAIVNMSSLAAKLGGAGESTDYAFSKGGNRYPHDRARQGACGRRHPRQRGATGLDRHRHPEGLWHRRPRGKVQGSRADEARRQRAGSGRGGGVVVLGRGKLRNRCAPGCQRGPRPLGLPAAQIAYSAHPCACA